MSGLRHSRELDPNTRQVNVTWSPGHVNCLSLFEVSSTLSIVEYRGNITFMPCGALVFIMSHLYIDKDVIEQKQAQSRWIETPVRFSLINL